MVNAPEFIDAVPCSRCGYDLRATPAGTVCPECGQYAWATLQGIRAENKYVVIRSQAKLPPRCIKTNEPVEDDGITKTLYWANPLLLLLILVNVVILAVVYLIVRKPCMVTYCMSKSVRKKIFYKRLYAVGLLLLGIAGVVGAFIVENVPLGLMSGLAIIVSLIVLAIYANPIGIAKYKNGEFWIKGCCPAFVHSLTAETMSNDAQEQAMV